MSEQRFVRYGDRTMPLEAGLTLDAVKELMARHFPELADPKVETQKDKAGTVTYVFSKKAGHKGRNPHLTSPAHKSRKGGTRAPISNVARRLCNLKAQVGNVDRQLVASALGQPVDYLAVRRARECRAEAEHVARIRVDLLNLPSATKPSGSVL